MLVDPFPDTATVVKASMFKVPLIGWALRQWGAIPVEREGRDSASIRRMLAVLRSGGVLAVAAEGRRTRSGRLEPINPVLARIAASSGLPILPLGISGSFRALPPGALLPRPVKILVRVGPPFLLPSGTSQEEAAERIRSEIAALLPPEMQPR
jgi:1-acyl-sn-glycerol-3-phosphate acyltransferase